MAIETLDESSERSPLLGGQAAQTPVPTFRDRDEPTASQLQDGSSDINHQSNGYGGVDDGAPKFNSSDEEAALERQSSAQSDRDRQFKGLPEVKKKIKYILPAIALGIFLAAADQSLIASSAGTIGSDLHDLKRTSWIATAYFLTLTTFQPLYGKLSDIFGRKPCLLFAYTIFGIGCLWCGLARTMKELIFARAVAGIGGGGMTTVVSILMSDIIPLRERGIWQGVINIIFATGAAVGAPLGGALSDSIGWRWAFMGQAPLCLLAFLCVLFMLHLPKTDPADWKTNLRRIDFLGALVLVCAVGSLLVGLDQGSNWSWKATVTIVCLAVSIPLFLAFVLVEYKIATEPFAPGRIIFERSLFASYLCNFFSFAGYFGVIFYLPIYYQASKGLNATQAGLGLLPGIVCGVLGSLLGGIIMQRTGHFKWLTVGGYTLLALSGIPIILFTGLVSHSPLGISIGLVMGGLGNGSGVTTSLISLISNAQPADQAIVTACSYLFRSLGSVLGLSVQAALFQALLRKNLTKELAGYPDAAKIAEKVRESLRFIEELSPEMQVKVRGAYTDSVTATFILMTVITFGATFASFFIREKRLSK